MSSILKALNRLKNEAPKQDETPSWPQEIDMKKAVRGDRKRGGFLKKLGYALAVLVVSCGMGWLVYSQKPHWIKKILPEAVSTMFVKDEGKEKTLSDKNKPSKIVVSVRKNAALSEKPTRLRKKAKPPRNSFQKEALTRKAPTKPVPVTPHGKASTSRPAPLPSRQGLSVSREGRSGAKFSRNLSQRRREPKKYAQKRGSNTRSSGRAAKAPELIKDSRFTLQAIAWSDDPKKRIAVINDHVVKEGASVKGAQVTRIGKEEVIIREGGKDYKLVFRLR